ncbi:hypothetical protein BKA70DRAFT_721476 [Coprinopsis sp. MPI-PUGE-AT-0042]|nr:hypothetical protein BKA70DRAFT_721476 [Coprinopsis sp. MPI-PUGE-AT-0042]
MQEWLQDSPCQRRHPASGAASSSPIQGIRTAQFNGGSFTNAGRDIVNIHHYHHHHLPSRTSVDVSPILGSPSLPNYHKMQLETFSRATEGTCLWFTDGTVLRAWMEDGKVLWGTGMPGAGKTFLMSIVVHELQNRANHSNGAICVAHVYIRYSEPLSVRDILEALLKQIVGIHHAAQEIVMPLYDQHQRSQTQPTQAELLRVLSDVCRLPGAFFLLVDGLDEITLESALAFTRGLASLRARLFITSRPLDDLATKFPFAVFFEIFAQKRDIDLHIEEAISRSVDLEAVLEDPSFKAEVTKTIHSQSQGMFLHAALQLDALRECLCVQDAREVLGDFPRNIVDVYHRTWERICHQTGKRTALAKQVLLWVLHAKREMSMQELRYAVATSPESYAFQPMRLVSPATITSVCCGLVVVDSELKVVRLVHYTAKDPLLQQLERIQTEAHAHAPLASICLTHLVTCGIQTSPLRGFDDFAGFLNDDPLLHYAYHSWYYHAQKSLQMGPAQSQDIMRFINGCQTYPLKWHGDIAYVGPFHVAAYYGFQEYFKLYTSTQNVGACVTPLVLAASQGHEACVRELLCRSDVDINAQDNFGFCALTIAIMNHHTAVVDLLLGCAEIDVNLAHVLGYTPLLQSSAHGNEDLVKRLLEFPKIHVNAILQAPSGWSSLMVACRNRCESVAKLLLAHPDVDPNLAGTDRGSALMIACANGDEVIVNLLLAHPRTEVNVATEDGLATLAKKFGRGGIQYRGKTYKDMREWEAVMLADYPGQIAPTPDGNWTALMHASKNGSEAIVKRLLAIPDIQVNTTSREGQTALSLASGENHSGVIKLLLDHPGIEMPFVTKDDVPPLVGGEIKSRS